MIKNTFMHPLTSRLGGLSVGAIITFAIAIGSFKTNFDIMQEDLQTIKPIVTQIQMDIVMIKTKLNIPIK